MKKAVLATILLLGLTVAAIATDHKARLGGCTFCRAGNKLLASCPFRK